MVTLTAALAQSATFDAFSAPAPKRIMRHTVLLDFLRRWHLRARRHTDFLDILVADGKVLAGGLLLVRHQRG